MKFLEEHQLAITTLTPVHIGCGEDYTPTDYIIDDGALFAFDSAGVSDALSGNARAQLLKLVKGNQQEEVLKQIQKLLYEQRKALIAKSSHYLPVAKGVSDLYKKRIGQTAQLESSGKRVVNRLEIERTFYNPASQKPIIPGSSLKGAIRTALLDSINNGNSLPEDEVELLGRRTEKEKKMANRKLQERLFQYRMKYLEKDPMRLIQLADSEILSEGTVASEIRFAVNRLRQEPKERQTKRTMAEDKGLYQLLEALPEMGLRTYSSRLTIQKVNRLQQSDKLPEKSFLLDN